MRIDYEADYFDYDFVNPELNRFLGNTRPEIRELLNTIIHKEGYSNGIYIFNQILVELVVRVGIEKATHICSRV